MISIPTSLKLSVMSARKILDLEESRLKDLSDRIDEIKRKEQTYEMSRKFLLHVSDTAQESISKYLENLVTLALRHVFGEGWCFNVVWDISGKTRTVNFRVSSPYENNDTIEDDPKDARGGGVQNIVSFSLWIAILGLAGSKGPIIMDEPFSWLSVDHTEDVISFLDMLREKLGMQIIMVTSHVNPVFNNYSDNVIEVSKQRGKSVIRLNEELAM